MELLAWTGSILLSICAAPSAYFSVKEGICRDNGYMLWIWFLGEICLFFYILPKRDYALMLNYGCNILFLVVMLRYKHFPRRKGGI